MQPEIPSFIYYSFLVLSVFIFLLFIREIRKAFPEKKSYVIVLSIWFLVQYIAGKLGFFLTGVGELPPKIMFVVLPNFIFLLYLAFSDRGKDFALRFGLVMLTTLQSFRIILEIILWQLAEHRLLPIEMSFEGRNFDIIIGLSAPVIAYMISKGKISKQGIIVWNAAGLLIITNVVVHGMLSVPGIEAIQTSIPNFIVSYAPFNLLPGVLVPIAYMLHILSLRKILNK